MTDPFQDGDIPRHEPDRPQTVFGARIPFVEFCGIEGLDIVDGRTRLRLTLGREHTNNLGIAHGGIVCTLLDVAMGTAARLRAGCSVLTIDMQARFLSPGRGILLAEGRVVRAGRSIMFCEAEITAETGDLIATATGVLKPVSQS